MSTEITALLRTGAVSGTASSGSSAYIKSCCMTPASAMFNICKKTGVFSVTKNIRAKHVVFPGFIPQVFPTHPDGFATVLNPKLCSALLSSNMNSTRGINLTPEDLLSHRLRSADPYSVTFRDGRKTSIIFGNETIEMYRRTGKCTGVKHCSVSSARASVSHDCCS